MRPSITAFKQMMNAVLPPLAVDWLKRIRHIIRFGRPEWQYLPGGWSTKSERIKGWTDFTIPKTQMAKWRDFVFTTQGTGPLGIAHEAPSLSNDDYYAHHMMMAYGYVLALAAHKKERLSLLDWGGGIGHYYVFSRRLMPELDIEYCCKDLPSLCCAGRTLLPECRFVEHEQEVAARRYDLTLVSGSLQYAENWKSMAQFLASVSDGYLYITRLPFVRQHTSFVAVQRMYAYGYDTECMGWVFNRDEFLDTMVSLNLKLVREFTFKQHPKIQNMKERPEIRGFLLRPKGTSTPCTSE